MQRVGRAHRAAILVVGWHDSGERAGDWQTDFLKLGLDLKLRRGKNETPEVSFLPRFSDCASVSNQSTQPNQRVVLKIKDHHAAFILGELVY